MPVNQPMLRILADDLSGAADCAASFTGAVGEVRLLLDEGVPSNTPCAIDADSRAASVAEAAARFARLGRACAGAVYKKIDSTLRGHIAAELDALVTAIGDVDRVVIAPAFPQQGRTLESGRPFVNGSPVASWPNGLATGLREVLGERYVIEALALRDVESPGLAEKLARMHNSIVVADGTRDTHLEQLARAIEDLPGRTLPVGSSGFARAIAQHLPLRVERSALGAPMLFVVGSFNAATRGQVDALRESKARMTLLDADTPLLAERVMESLRSKRSALVHLPFAEAPPIVGDRSRVRALAKSIAPAIEHCGTLLLTGGDTARAVLEALGVGSLPIVGELEPGIAVARLANRCDIVLKAGGFGDNGVFVRLASP